MKADDLGWRHRHVDIDGLRAFVRVSTGVGKATPIVHVHGFGISGSYLMPTARLLTDRALNVVPDLPGYGRSQKPARPLDIPHLADAVVTVLDALEIEQAVLVGNSMGCSISVELADRHTDRVERVVLVAPAGGQNNVPLRRAVRQLAMDGMRENPRMARVAVPDYVRFGPINTLRLFTEMTQFPSLERLLEIRVPTLGVIGSRDPLLPGRQRVNEVATQVPGHVTLVLITGAAHAVNFSHPGELAHVIGSWLDDAPIVDDPDQPGLATVLQIPRA
ncbi:MAG: alpha/beta fold hydrolase [Humibacillus sp.]|nr:alpha/beta fold hydrolase [Humibacillus sp.]MDN5775752.1 alpha/beta fold hydrolase [Humibacillus sp.]